MRKRRSIIVFELLFELRIIHQPITQSLISNFFYVNSNYVILGIFCWNANFISDISMNIRSEYKIHGAKSNLGKVNFELMLVSDVLSHRA